MAATPITWNDPTTAKANLTLDAYGGVTVLFRVDTNNVCARGNGPKYRSARYAPAASAGLSDNWYDLATGFNLYTAVTGWALPE